MKCANINHSTSYGETKQHLTNLEITSNLSKAIKWAHNIVTKLLTPKDCEKEENASL